MMKFIYSFLFVLLSISIFAQVTPEYSRAKILLENEESIHELNALNVLCHGHHARGRYFISDFSKKEIRIIKEAGFEVEILIDDVQEHYVQQNEHNHDHRAGETDCSDPSEEGIQTPANFELGSIGGYLTYAELLAELDKMHHQYPNLISAKAPISTTLLTHEGREVQWVRISDNPTMDEGTAEPEIFYNAITHAREPGGMMQMVFHMWYLLENYDSDPEIKYLVDNIEMYFVPCINPDGYIYNETTNPNGGGLWRKNRKDNGDGTFGVDLNRNYSYAWADDDNGSSPNTNSDTYRGTAPFSEPETQLVKMFTEDHDFKICLNYHTYTNLLLRPWGHTNDLPADIDIFDAFGQLMVEDNGYAYGGAEVIGYFVNGDTDSYMYGDEGIIAMTPEVGNSFWSPAVEIEEDGKDNLLSNLYVAKFVLNYGRAVENNNPDNLVNLNGLLDFTVKKYGMLDGDLSVSLSSPSMINTSTIIPLSLSHLQDGNVGFNYELDPNTEAGDEITFTINIDNGEHVFQQEFKKAFGVPANSSIVVSDAGDNMDNWESGSFWGITNARFHSEPTSIADSPQGDYQDGNTAYLNLSTPLDLSNATEAFITFKAEWDIEASYDYCQLQAATTSNNYEALCGRYTTDGSGNQAVGEPLWDGTKTGWVTEKLSLDGCLGESNVSLRFVLAADNFVSGDGFFFDDFNIVVVTDGETSVYEFTVNDFSVENYPNPSKTHLNISLSSIPENGKIVFYNQLGQTLFSREINSDKININTNTFSNGIYFYSIYSNAELLASRKVSVLR
jgi:carboxypeptidase T